ncbi:MAG TPA: MopE-related protein, partial [Myxococcota bacterium]|nr:MopE-related protein [Myxococcota bacterium]
MPRQPTPALHDAAWGARAALGREVSARQPRALPGGHWALHNARTGLEGFVSRVGLEADDGSGAPIRLSLRRWGRERSETPVEIATVTLGGCAPAWETDARGDCRRQVALHRPDLVETWESGPDGLLHAFRLLPPPGDGAVLLHIGVEGAAPQPTGPDEVWLQEADRAWRYAGLAAWDERGAPLPARMEVAGDEIVLRVDAPPGAGWISVDPALTDGAVWRDAPADEPRAQFGMAVAGVGDVDGDGYDDVMVGAPYLDAQVVDQGRLFLYRGGPTGLSDRASQTFDSPTLYYALFGLSFAAAGDVNGDGMGDVIVGAPYANDDVADEGMVWLYLGSPGGLVSPPAWSQSPANQGAAHTGVSVASAGDVNGDGFDDVLVGSPRFSAQAQDEGRAWLYLGSPSGLEPTPAWVADPTDQAYAQFGGAVSAAGDVNADGYGDVVISAVNFNGQERQEGRAYLYLGGPAGLQASPAWSRDPTDVYNCLFGQELASAGDVDGDGHDDVVICGCVDEPRYGKEGAAYLYHGDTAGLLNRYSWLEHPSNDSGFDYCDSVDRAGDVNGDGFGDVIVGASSYAGDVGEAWLYLGSAGGLATAEAWRLAAGDAVASAGDVNGDGYGDVIIGDATYSRPGAVSAGRAALFLGCPGTQEVAGDLVDQDCDGAILCYHDADGDGFSVAGTPVVLSSNLSCSDPGEALQRPREGDCDDSSAAAHPGGLELPGNEVDEDCDGAVVCVWDEDGDGYAPVPWGTIPSQDMDCRDPYELITPGAAADCDDRDAGRHPGATEQPLNDLDDDCDGQVACFRDADGDGSPSARPSLADGGSCAELGLSVQPGSAPDCDDADPAVHPGAAEAVGTEQDTNCDGLLLCYADPDHDGFTLAAPGAEPSLDGDCDDPGEAATPSAASDCAEGDPAIHPGASET